MALPWRSKFSFKDMRNDVSGFRLGGTPAPNQNPMQTLNEDVSDSWAGGSSSSAHQSMQTSRQDSSSVQTHELVSGYWGDGIIASSHYPMQTGNCCSKLISSLDMFSVQTHLPSLLGSRTSSTVCTVPISAQDSLSNGRNKNSSLHMVVA